MHGEKLLSVKSFSDGFTNFGSEQTLPAPIQAEITQIKQEVPEEQVPQVSVPAQTPTTPAAPAALGVSTERSSWQMILDFFK